MQRDSFAYFLIFHRVTKPEETVFHLLHLSLMREYLDFEFGELKVTQTGTKIHFNMIFVVLLPI